MTTDLDLMWAGPPLSARSVGLSLLLGSREPQLSARELTQLGELFDIASPTMRVALSRMVAAGDVHLADTVYTLAGRHLERQSRTEELIHPERGAYDGTWLMAVVVDRGRAARERSALRADLTGARFAELREGVWLRPHNLGSAPAGLRTFTTVPDDAAALSRELWDLDAWATRARGLLVGLAESGRPVDRLTVAAAAVRHLCADPVLPDELTPDDWPGESLRAAYENYRSELTSTVLTPQESR